MMAGYDPFETNRAIEGMGRNALSNALALANMRRQQQQDALSQERMFMERKRNALDIQNYLSRVQQEEQNRLKQNNQLAAQNEVFSNLDYLGQDPAMFNTRAGELMGEVSRNRLGVDLQGLYKEVSGMRPKGLEVQNIGGVPYVVENGKVRIAEGYEPQQNQSNSTPYFTPVYTPQGVVSFNAREGTAAPLMVNGQTVMGANFDPTLQGRIAQEKEAGKVYGETTATARVNLPQDIQEAENTIGLVDELLRHPGFRQAVGKSSLLGVQKVPGTEAKAFMVRLDQLKGKQFLQAFQALKGGGQITEIEGKKATDAISRMDNATTESEFVTAAKEFQGIIKQGVERAKKKAQGGQQQTNNNDPLGIR